MRLAEAELGDKSLSLWREDAAFRTRKRRITARSPGQAAYIKALRENELVFGLGPAGTGKTYLAVAAAVDLLMSGRVERSFCPGRRSRRASGSVFCLATCATRSIRTCGRSSMRSTTCCRPISSASGSGTGEIEVAPIAFMRGRTCRMPS